MTFIDKKTASVKSFFQFFIIFRNVSHMLHRGRTGRIFTDAALFARSAGSVRPPAGFQDIRPDGINIRPVIGKFGVDCLRCRSCHDQIRVAVHGENTFPDHHVKHIFFIKKEHPVRIKIPQVLTQLSHLGKAPVRINGIRKFIIRVWIIEMIVGNATFGKKLFKSAPCKGTQNDCPDSSDLKHSRREHLGKALDGLVRCV